MVTETESGVSFCPPAFPEGRTPRWAVFDPSWYRVRYKDAIANLAGDIPDDQALARFWREHGARHGHSPSRLFDEIWYRRAFPDVENGIRLGVFDSGFQHYDEIGCKGRSGHWLFSEQDYFRINDDLTVFDLHARGYANGYDHYLAVGDREGRFSHLFFNPEILRASIFERRLPYDENVGAFSSFLFRHDISELRCSWYFDPSWYLERYPEVAELIASGDYACSLHHYLSNDRPTAFDPNPYFSERFYADAYPDVAAFVSARGIRNGFAHFLTVGIYEGRQPAPDVDLSAFVAAHRRRSRRTHTLAHPFADYVAQAEQGVVRELAAPMVADQYAFIGAARAETLSPLLARSPLDFTVAGEPAASVVVQVRRGDEALLTTLSSLHAGSAHALEVIVVHDGLCADVAELGRYTRGIHVLNVQARGGAAGLTAAMACVSAERVLLLEAGVSLYPGALDAALARLEDESCVAVAPQALGADLHVQEAGVTVFRDGHLLPRDTGLPAFSPEVSFVRLCDTVGAGAMLCRTDAMRRVSLMHWRDQLHAWAALGLALRETGGTIAYDPCFLVRGVRLYRATETCQNAERAMLRERFSALLRGKPTGAPRMDVRARHVPGVTRVLFVVPSLPLVAHGGHAACVAETIATLAERGEQVTVCPLASDDVAFFSRLKAYPDNVEVLAPKDAASFGVFLDARAQSFDVVWIWGGETLNRVSYFLHERAYALPTHGFVLDARGSGNDVSGDDAADALREAWFCQVIVVGDEVEAASVRERGYRHVRCLGAPPVVKQGLAFPERRGLLFGMPAHTPADEGYRQLEWLLREVFPRLDGLLPEDVTLALGEMGASDVDRAGMIWHRRVEAPGVQQEAWSDLLKTRRVLIVPTLWRGALPYEAMQAAGYGLPSVMAGDGDDAPCLLKSFDPSLFAEGIAQLYQSETLWAETAARARTGMGDVRDYHMSLQRILDEARMMDKEK